MKKFAGDLHHNSNKKIAEVREKLLILISNVCASDMSMDEPYCHGSYRQLEIISPQIVGRLDLVVPGIHKVTIRDNCEFMRFSSVFIENRDKVVA